MRSVRVDSERSKKSLSFTCEAAADVEMYRLHMANPSRRSSTCPQRLDSGSLRLMLFSSTHNDRCHPRALLKPRRQRERRRLHTKANRVLRNRDAFLFFSPLKEKIFFLSSSSFYASHILFKRGRARSPPSASKLLTQQTLPSASARNRKRSAPSQTIPFQRGQRSVYDRLHYHKLIHKLGNGEEVEGASERGRDGLCGMATDAACCLDTVRGAERPSGAACLLSGCGQGR